MSKESPDWGTSDSTATTGPTNVTDSKGPELLQGTAKPRMLLAWRPFLLRYLQGWLAGVALLIIAIAVTDPAFLGRGAASFIPLAIVTLIMGTPFAWVTDLVLRDTVTRRTHLLIAAALGGVIGTAAVVFGTFPRWQALALIVGLTVGGFLVRLAAGFRGLPTADRPAQSGSGS